MESIVRNKQLLLIVGLAACTPRVVESPTVRPDTSGLPSGTSTALAREWKRLQVTPAAKATKSLVDSVITVRTSRPGELEVIYTFNNSCQATIEGFALREADTLLVRFRPRMKREGDPAVGDVPLCPASIQMEAFSVRVCGFEYKLRNRSRLCWG
jgi:hypothetical protein